MGDPRDLESELSRHASGLRSIARDLLRDHHAAEDVAQDAAHRALVHRPAGPGPLRAWLHRTAVNFAHQWRRRERRRADRHERLPTPEPAASTSDVLSRREVLKSVTDAVLALDEPYQTAVFLRYFEDLSPAAIAARTGAPLPTVKSRLQRGLAQLRMRLDRQCGGDRDRWRLAVASTFGLHAAATTAAAVSLGIWLMGTTTKTLVAAGVLCAGGLLVYGLRRDPAPPVEPLAATDHAAGAAPARGGTETGSAADPSREAAPADADPTDWLAHPFTLELEVRLVDPLGLPVQGRTLRLAPSGCTLDQAPKATGPDGTVVIQWSSRQPTGEIVVADPQGFLHPLALQHGTRRKVTFGASGHRGELRISGGRFTLTTTPILSGVPIVGKAVAADSEYDARRFLHPFAVWTSAAPPAQGGPTLIFDSVIEIVADTAGVSLVSKGAPAPSAPLPRIAGTVFGEDGAIAAGVPVALLGSGPQPIARATTDARGEFAFEGLQPGEFTVRAGGDAAGLGTAAAITTTGTTPVAVHLRRETFLRGRARTATGAPIAGARVHWIASDGSWWDSTETQPDGAFVLANLPAERGRVLLMMPDRRVPLPVAVVEDALAGTGDLVLTYDAAAAAALRCELDLPEAVGADDVGGRLWNLDLGLGATWARPENGTSWRSAGLPAGWYRAELFVPTAGFVDLGRQWLEPKADCDLGAVVPPAPCEVEVASAAPHDPEAPPPPPTELELYALRADLDVRLRVGDLTADCRLLLPAGDYALAHRGAAGEVRFERFTARRAGPARVLLPQ